MTIQPTSSASALSEDANVEEEARIKDEARAKPVLTDWLVVILLMLTMMFSYVDRFTLSLLAEPIKTDLKLTDAEIGLLNGFAFGVVFALMGVPFGWLADRWSRTRAMMLGVGIWSVSTAASGFAGTFSHLLVSRVGVGAGEAGLAPAAYGLIHDRFPRRYLGRAMSLFQLGTILGSGVALLVAGSLYKLFSGGFGAFLPIVGSLSAWQKTFVAVGAPGIVFILLLFFIREPVRQHQADQAEEKTQSLMTVLSRDLFGYAALFVGMSCITATAYSLMSWLPAIMTREFGWTPAEIGALFGLVALTTGPIGIISGGILADWFTTRGVRAAYTLLTVAAAVLALPLVILIGLAPSANQIVVLGGLLMVVVALPIGIVPALVQTLTPAAARGRMSGLYVVALNLIGLGIAPTLIGAVSDQLGTGSGQLRRALVLVIAPLLMVGVALLARLYIIRRGAEGRSP